MGHGVFTATSYLNYSESVGKSVDSVTGYITSGQQFIATGIDSSLDPKVFKIRECCNTEEHPNTIPVILGLDVTGSMGEACMETAKALGVIITNLYDKFQDIEFCVMGIGDIAYDRAPIQMSQFESDVRIAESLDKIYMEHGGGGNTYESYTAAWYMGLYHTQLDCYDKQGRKGIIITMGDEPLNPYLSAPQLNYALNGKVQVDIETKALYEEARKKFDIYHIAVDSPNDCYAYHAPEIKKTFGKLLGEHLKISTVNMLAQTIEECITESIQSGAPILPTNKTNEKGEISW